MLRVARIVSVTLVPASSAINPIIYPARIRRFRLTIKKLLHLTISQSDKYETYEIRQSFRVKRKTQDFEYGAVPVIEPVSSSDSGVDGLHCDETEQNYHTEKPFGPYTCKIDRSLSRISESPEHRSRGCSVTSDAEVIIHRQLTDIDSSDTSHEPDNTVGNNMGRRASRPQFLDLPITTQSAYQPSPTNIQPTCGTLYDNVTPSRLMSNLYPRDIADNSHTPAAVDANYLCTEPIVVDCDSKSDYFRLVVKRTVRDCDSDSDDAENPTHLPSHRFNSTRKDGPDSCNSSIRMRSKSKPKYLHNRHSNISLNKCSATDSPQLNPGKLHHSTTTPVLTPCSSRSPRIIHHRRYPSNQSTSSLGLTLDNDDIELEISDAGSVGRKRNNFMQLTYASLQRRKQKHELLQELTEKDPSNRNTAKEFWDGTLRKLKGQKKLDKLKPAFQSKLSRQASISLTDVSRPTQPKTVHKRSRSDLDENMSPTTIKIDHLPTSKNYVDERPSHNELRKLSPAMRQSVELQINHLSSSDDRSYNQHVSAMRRANSIDHLNVTKPKQTSVTTNNDIAKISITDRDMDSMEKGGLADTDIPLSAPYHKRDTSFFSELVTPVSRGTASLSRNTTLFSGLTPSSNDVMLPVRIRLRGGGEEEMVLTKQDIYSHYCPDKSSEHIHNVVLQKTRKTRRVMRNRSMSQPSISTITKWRGHSTSATASGKH